MDGSGLILFETLIQAVDQNDGLIKTFSGYMAAQSWETAESMAPPFITVHGVIVDELEVSNSEVDWIKTEIQKIRN